MSAQTYEITGEYEPRGACRELFYARDLEVLLEGPAGTGKTRALLEKVHALADKYPGSRHLLCRKTRISLSESILVIYEDHVLSRAQRDHLSGQRKSRQSYVYPNGSTLVLGGLDNVDRIMSAEYDTVSLFEATEADENDWEKLTSRLRNNCMPYQQALADCNPGHPTHWINKRCNDLRMRRLSSRHADNPTITPVYLDRLARLSGVRRLRLYEGLWVAHEGLVYDNFSHALHVVDRFEIPVDWPRFAGIDWGYRNPTAILWAAMDPDGRLYVYRELYQAGVLPKVLAPRVIELEAEERVVARWADHDASERAEFSSQGVGTFAADKAVLAGIQEVYDRLQPDATGKPALFLFRDCLVSRDHEVAQAGLPTSVLEEVQSYSWAISPASKQAKEEPEKKNDHGCDAIRYLCMGVRNWSSAPNIKFA